LAGLGRDLARFHAVAAACLEDPTGYGEQLQRSVQATLCTLREHVPLARAAQIGELGAWLETELRRRQGLLARRAREGHVREGHGDLHARNIVLWNGRLVPFDCLEFDLRLRCIDVLADAGFLVMDLRAQGRLDLAATFLNAYLEQSGDYAGLPLLPCFAVHRALVRAMVDALAIDQHPQRGELRERLEARLGAAATWRQSQRPLLCLMHGLSGSGKSWLSEQLVGPLGALRLRSDLERRRSPPAGTPPSADRSDRYDPAARRAVYQRLANAAAACLAAGLHTLVDATFLQETDRKVFRDLAAREGATLRILSCRAPRERLAERIRARAGSTDPSEATVEVLARQIRAQEPLTQAELALTIDVDTGRDDALAATLDALRSSLTSSKPL